MFRYTHFTTSTSTHQRINTSTHQHITNSHRLSPTLTDSHRLSPTLTNSHQHSPTLTNTHQHSPTLTNTHQHLPTLTNTHQHSPTSQQTFHQNKHPSTTLSSLFALRQNESANSITAKGLSDRKLSMQNNWEYGSFYLSNDDPSEYKTDEEDVGQVFASSNTLEYSDTGPQHHGEGSLAVRERKSYIAGLVAATSVVTEALESLVTQHLPARIVVHADLSWNFALG
ncbi:hypothetical protein PENARI_c111G00221 [Penicillium arizonense]|uniref:Uncharacterized protein n=1 Tax=Penicillium arizonense TaxID=1835702 RepID=A0A1F5L1H6_PENAI|nr:hypothetical protein PENARI_c111G00221 [Penicillium arizonense]OGE46781.1 hypothetical protein PENARI_c111G00221 [Penicillium arizonense]